MTNERKVPSIKETIDKPDAQDAQISPDGRHVAFAVRSPDWKKDYFVWQLWLVNTSGGKPRQLTFGSHSSHSARWSPDGEWLAFLSRRHNDDHSQIYRISPFGGEAERLTEHATNIQTMLWAPDSKQIAFTAIDQETEAEKERRKRYGDYLVEDEDYWPSRLWCLNIESRKTRLLTGGKSLHVMQFDWSPAADALVFAAAPTPDISHWDLSRLYHLDLATIQATPLTAEGCQNPCWSPDGNWIAYTRAGEPTYLSNNRLEMLAVSGGEIKGLLPDFDESVLSLTWYPSGLYFMASYRSEGRPIYRLLPHEDSPKRLTPENWFGSNYCVSYETGRIAQVAGDVNRVPEVFCREPESGEWRCLTNYTEAINDWELPGIELYRWQSRDGTEIEGILSKPADFDPEKKYPLLVITHGGPSSASYRLRFPGEARRVYPIIQWVARGAVILQPNYRGSTGFGGDFRALNVRNLGVGDADDILSGVDALLAEGWIDGERMGAMGWSQGGYISAFLATTSDCFRAISVGAGISNWVTYYVNTDIHPFTRQYLGATPWEEMEIYRRTSPMTYIDQACTPTLIQHGELDMRVPIPNAYELYQGLQDMGVETRLVVYQGMGHGPGDSPLFCRHVMEDNDAWFSRWIWDQVPAEDAARQHCYVAAPGVDWSEIQQEARRDDVDFRWLSGELGLFSVETTIPEGQTAIEAASVSILAMIVSEQLSEQGWQKITLYTQPAKQEPASLIALGCLQVAAGLVASCQVTHREWPAEEAPESD